VLISEIHGSTWDPTVQPGSLSFTHCLIGARHMAGPIGKPTMGNAFLRFQQPERQGEQDSSLVILLCEGLQELDPHRHQVSLACL
jgi:hypothetical protein